MDILKNLRIRGRLLAMLAVPMAALLGYCLLDAWAEARNAIRLGTVQALGALAREVGQTVHELQKERGLTAGFLGSKGQKFASEVAEIRNSSDSRILALKQGLTPFITDQTQGGIRAKAASARDALNQLDHHRQGASAFSISTPEHLANYTGLIGALLDLAQEIPHHTQEAELFASAQSLVQLMRLKEASGIERATLNAALTQDRFAEGVFQRYATLVGEQAAEARSFRLLAAEPLRKTLDQALQGPFAESFASMRKTAFQRGEAGGFGIDPAAWFKVSTQRIDALREVEVKAADDLAGRAALRHESARRAFIRSIGVFILVLSAASTLAILVGRSILQPLRSCTAAAERIASGDLVAFQPAQGVDETAQLQQAMGRMSETLRGLLEALRNMSLAHEAGDIDARLATPHLHGTYRTMAEGVNGMVEGHVDLNRKVMACVSAFGEGRFDAPLESFPGKKAENNRIVEVVRSNLQRLCAELGHLIEASRQGRLETRGDATRFHGDWQGMIQGLNELLEGVVAPLRDVTAVMGRLAQGELQARMTGRYDGDFGRLGASVDLTAESLTEAVSGIQTDSSRLARAAEALRGTAGSLARNAGEAKAQSLQVDEGSSSALSELQSVSQGIQSVSGNARSVAAATEEVTANLHTVGAAVEEMSSNMAVIASSTNTATGAVESVAAAVEEMGNSLREVSRNTDQAAEVASGAVGQAREAAAIMDRLGASAVEIGQVVDLIREIADQTNLLALNATIEAASAGDAGRGFAVVAGEVKALARQTAMATQNIRSQVEGVQTSTQQAIESIQGIQRVISRIQEVSTNIASSVDAQTATTREITRNVGNAAHSASEVARNVQQAALGAGEVSRNVQEAVRGSSEISENIQRLAMATQEVSHSTDRALEGMKIVKVGVGAVDASNQSTSRDADSVDQASKDLAALSERLQQAVARFRTG